MPYTCSCGYTTNNRRAMGGHIRFAVGEHESLGMVDPETGETVVPPQDLPKDPVPKKAPVLRPASQTFNASEATLIKLLSQAQVIVMTPEIFTSYMCAVRRGFEGSLSGWLSMVSKDFWLGREIDPFREVSGGAARSEMEVESNGDGAGQAVGAGSGAENQERPDG